MEQMTPQERRKLRRRQVERCLASDLTVKEWCKLNGLHPSTWYNWAAVFRKEEPELFAGPNASKWFEVSRQGIRDATAIVPAKDAAKPAPSHAPAAANAPSCLVARVNGVEIAIPEGCGQATIEAAFRAAAAL